MTKKEITIKSEIGLHASAATKFIKIAAQYQSDLVLEVNGRKGKGKSLLGIMSLGIAYGDVVLMIAEGPDEQGMIDALVELNERRYE